jgi:hypothetical protein
MNVKTGDDVCESLASPLPGGSGPKATAPSSNDKAATIATRSKVDDQRIALHECSHALAGRVLGSTLGGVTCDAGPDYSGLCWGPPYDRRSKFAKGEEVPSLCAQIGPLMPGPGDNRADVADIYLHVHTRIIELAAGSVGEALFLEGPPWNAAHDRAQERALASLICTSPEAIESFIAFCTIEAVAALRPREHIVRKLTKELLLRRTMTGTDVDEVILEAVSAEAAEAERLRRLAWQRAEESAARLSASIGH